MARFDNEVRITPSVLDRLIDFEPEVSKEPPSSRSKSLRLLKQSLRRDLEWLLNTRHTDASIPADLVEVNKSVAVYGLRDFTNASAKNVNEQNALRKEVETALARFEPRLQSTIVTIEPLSVFDRVLRFKIDAQLDVDPAPEPIVFDTVLQLGKGEFQLKGE